MTPCPRHFPRRRSGFLPAFAIVLAALACSFPAPARVVINEIMYHPPEDRDELQWVELLNTGPEPVDLEGWSFKKGIDFRFPGSTVLPPGGFAVVTRDRGAFRIRYGTQGLVFGDFKGRLSHNGETLELVDRAGATVDTVKYSDAEPWPGSADGMSPSLEKIVALEDGSAGWNWAPSPMPDLEAAGGTPGRPNANVATNLPPVIADARITNAAPALPIVVSARVQDPDGLRSVKVLYQTLDLAAVRGSESPGATPAEREITLSRASGNDTNGVYSAEIPAQKPGTLVRARVRAEDRTGAVRLSPHPDEARPTWSVFVGSNTNQALIPFASLVQLGPTERRGASLRTAFEGPGGRRGRAAAPTGEPARGKDVLVFQPNGGGPVRLFDHIRLTPRHGGWKVRLHKDQLLDGMSTVNVLFEYQPRFVLSEHLAYELYRAAGVPAPSSGHWRVWYNGRPLGYHLFVEQPNSTFLRRRQRDPDGDLFKLLWYGHDLISQHEKKNNPETGHAELVAIIEALRGSQGERQWQIIQKNFQVDEFATYYAVNMCLQNWDGFFNNYFVYRAPGPEGKWEIFPWDEDKTWGDYDGASPKYDWYTMPLSMGMAGDQPGGSLFGRFAGQGPFGGQSWWRPPGHFSGPLLANPQFRARFLARLRELCRTEFTPEKMEAPIALMEKRLEPEVRYRAAVAVAGNTGHRDLPNDLGPRSADQVPAGRVEDAVAQFQRYIDSYRRQVTNRRAFLLQELARAK